MVLIHVQNGQTALYIASGNGHDQIVELLLKKEADVNHQTKVRPLMLASVFLHEDFFQHKEYICGLVICITIDKVTNDVPGKQIIGYKHQDIVWIHPIKVSVFTVN